MAKQRNRQRYPVRNNPQQRECVVCTVFIRELACLLRAEDTGDGYIDGLYHRQAHLATLFAFHNSSRLVH